MLVLVSSRGYSYSYASLHRPGLTTPTQSTRGQAQHDAAISGVAHSNPHILLYSHPLDSHRGGNNLKADLYPLRGL